MNQAEATGTLLIPRDTGMVQETPQVQFYNLTPLLAGLLLLLLIVEWGMYHREKY